MTYQWPTSEIQRGAGTYKMGRIVLPHSFSIIKGLQNRIHLNDVIFRGFLQKEDKSQHQRQDAQHWRLGLWAQLLLTIQSNLLNTFSVSQLPQKAELLLWAVIPFQVQPSRRLFTEVQPCGFGAGRILANFPSSKKQHQMQRVMQFSVLSTSVFQKRVLVCARIERPTGEW